MTLEADKNSVYDDLIITYNKPENGGFGDTQDEPNIMDSFQLYINQPVYDAGVSRTMQLNSPTIEVEGHEIRVSEDGKYAAITLNGFGNEMIDYKNKDINIYINGELWSYHNRAVLSNGLTFFVSNKKATPQESYDVKIGVADYYSEEEDTSIANMVGEEISLPLSFKGVTPIVDHREFSNATYHSDNSTLTIDYNTRIDFSNASLFTLIIDGTCYRLRSNVDLQQNSSQILFDENCLFNLIDKIDGAQEIFIKYDPITTIERFLLGSMYDSGKPLDRIKLPISIQ